MTYQQACEIVRNAGLDVVDGLALTYSCADYPDTIRNLNGLPVEDAAAEIQKSR